MLGGRAAYPIPTRRSDLKREIQKKMEKGKAGLSPAFPPDNLEVMNEVSFFFTGSDPALAAV